MVSTLRLETRGLHARSKFELHKRVAIVSLSKKIYSHYSVIGFECGKSRVQSPVKDRFIPKMVPVVPLFSIQH